MCDIGHELCSTTDVNDTFRRLGRRQAGLIIMSWLTEEPRELRRRCGYN